MSDPALPSGREWAPLPQRQAAGSDRQSPRPRKQMSLAFKSAARVGPSSASYEQAPRCSTAAWPAAPGGPRRVKGSAARAKNQPDTFWVIQALFTAAPSRRSPHGPCKIPRVTGRLLMRNSPAAPLGGRSRGAQQ